MLIGLSACLCALCLARARHRQVECEFVITEVDSVGGFESEVLMKLPCTKCLLGRR